MPLETKGMIDSNSMAKQKIKPMSKQSESLSKFFEKKGENNIL